MPESISPDRKLSRRKFLKTTAILGAGAAVATGLGAVGVGILTNPDSNKELSQEEIFKDMLDSNEPSIEYYHQRARHFAENMLNGDQLPGVQRVVLNWLPDEGEGVRFTQTAEGVVGEKLQIFKSGPPSNLGKIPEQELSSVLRGRGNESEVKVEVTYNQYTPSEDQIGAARQISPDANGPISYTSILVAHEGSKTVGSQVVSEGLNFTFYSDYEEQTGSLEFASHRQQPTISGVTDEIASEAISILIP